jgi:hypothetical protein
VSQIVHLSEKPTHTESAIERHGRFRRLNDDHSADQQSGMRGMFIGFPLTADAFDAVEASTQVPLTAI